MYILYHLLGRTEHLWDCLEYSEVDSLWWVSSNETQSHSVRIFKYFNWWGCYCRNMMTGTAIHHWATQNVALLKARLKASLSLARSSTPSMNVFRVYFTPWIPLILLDMYLRSVTISCQTSLSKAVLSRISHIILLSWDM
jgi:hypothetical protein